MTTVTGFSSSKESRELVPCKVTEKRPGARGAGKHTDPANHQVLASIRRIWEIGFAGWGLGFGMAKPTSLLAHLVGKTNKLCGYGREIISRAGARD